MSCSVCMHERVLPGLCCPRCAGGELASYKVRLSQVGAITRVRKCTACKLKIRTGERIEGIESNVVA